MSRNRKSKRKSNARKKKQTGAHPLLYEVIGLVMIGLAIIIMFEFGLVGRALSSFSRFSLGNWHGAIPLLLIVQALIFMIMRKMGGWKNRVMGGSLLVLASLLLFSHVYLFKELNASRVLMSDSAIKETWKVLVTNDGVTSRSGALGGGMIGAFIFAMFYSLFDSAGATVAGVLLLLIGIVLLTGKALVPYIAESFPKHDESIKKTISEKFTREKKKETPTRQTRSKKPKTSRTKVAVVEPPISLAPIIVEMPSQPIM